MMESDHLVPDVGAIGERMTKGEQTRRKIVAAAAPIFNQHGYEGSSLADLMTATGLKKGGIYRHFSSKEELAAEAFDYTWEAAWKARMLHVDENATGIEKLKQLIANFIDYRSPVAGGCPILNTAVDADDGNPVLRARVGKALRSWVARLESIVKQAAVRGERGVRGFQQVAQELLGGAMGGRDAELHFDVLAHDVRHGDGEFSCAGGIQQPADLLETLQSDFEGEEDSRLREAAAPAPEGIATDEEQTCSSQ